MSHQLFIKNLEGPSYNIKVDLKTERVKDLVQKYSKLVGEQEGKSAQLVFAGKLLNTEKYQGQLLSQFSIMDGSTIFVAMRLRGGKSLKATILGVNSQQYKIEVDDSLTGYQLKQHFYNNASKSLQPQLMALRYAGVQIQNDKKLSYYKIAEQKGALKIFQEKCSLGKIAGIILAYEEDPISCETQTVRMPCGHVIGRDTMTQFIRALISCWKYNIQCPSQKPNGEDCNCEWQFSLCRKIGVFTKEQIHEFQEGLSINWLKDQTSPCPSCKFRVMKGDLKSNRVVCPKCKYGDYCFKCSNKWRNNGFDLCGNPECKQINDILSQSEWNKTFELKSEGKMETFYLPQLRACPDEKCHQLVNHSGGCKHMSCPKCKKQFCWVCLEIRPQNGWNCGSYNDYCGKIAPTQEF